MYAFRRSSAYASNCVRPVATKLMKPGGRGGGFGWMLGAALVAAAAFSTGAAAQALTTLHSFGGSDGAGPSAGLIADAAGNLYGTTADGGATTICVPTGCGTVFELTPTETLTVLHSFAVFGDGGVPLAGLIADAAGNLYGTTANGGASSRGTVFELTPTGAALTVLHSFSSTGSDGANPSAGLIADAAGNLYGTTAFGGAGTNCPSGCGTVFKLMPTGTLTVLHSFGGSDGANPSAGLIADAAGNLYGTTADGGAGTNCPSGCGTVFELTPTGTLTVLHSFTFSDGANPFAGLIADAVGNLYGTTISGGVSGRGTVFELTPTGTLTVLHSFTGSDGGFPSAGLIADATGNLYGTTSEGGASANCSVFGCGTVFKLTPTGTLTVLHSFAGSDGETPSAGLIADAAGNLYGTTQYGGASTNCGASGCGTVFKLAGSGFVSTVPFAWLDAGLIIHGGQRARFELEAEFGLGASSNGINPPSEPVTLQIGPYTATIPAGSFRQLPGGKHWSVYAFIGEENNLQLSLDILSLGPNSYQLGATGWPINLTVPNRMPVSLQIGDNSGSAVVKAARLH